MDSLPDEKLPVLLEFINWTFIQYILHIYDYTYVHCVHSGQRTSRTQLLSLYNNIHLYNEINSTRGYRTYYITGTKRGKNHISILQTNDPIGWEFAV